MVSSMVEHGVNVHEVARQDPVPLEYSIERLTWAIADRPSAVMVGWPGATQDRLPAEVPRPRRGRAGVPWRPGEGR